MDIADKTPCELYRHAQYVIKGRWPEAEPFIMRDPQNACYYAKYVICSRWPEAEPYITRDSYYAYDYARFVIEGRWPEAEEIIMSDQSLCKVYVKFILTLSGSRQKMTPQELTLFKLKFSEYL